MNIKQSLIKQTLVVSSTLLALLIAGSTLADDGAKLDKRGDRIDKRLDEKGEHIDKRLDKKAERINHRLDKRADRRK